MVVLFVLIYMLCPGYLYGFSVFLMILNKMLQKLKGTFNKYHVRLKLTHANVA